MRPVARDTRCEAAGGAPRAQPIPRATFKHLDRASLRVVASLIRIVGDEPQLAEPKSRRSRRQVELSAYAVEALRRHRSSAPSIGFVFARPDGRPLAVTTTWKRWRALLLRAKVPAMPFHRARHSAATLLLSRGVHPKIVSEMLGHSTVAITLDVYSHVTPAMHREAARIMDELLSL
jgi:integrase